MRAIQNVCAQTPSQRAVSGSRKQGGQRYCCVDPATQGYEVVQLTPDDSDNDVAKLADPVFTDLLRDHHVGGCRLPSVGVASTVLDEAVELDGHPDVVHHEVDDRPLTHRLHLRRDAEPHEAQRLTKSRLAGRLRTAVHMAQSTADGAHARSADETRCTVEVADIDETAVQTSVRGARAPTTCSCTRRPRRAREWSSATRATCTVVRSARQVGSPCKINPER